MMVNAPLKRTRGDAAPAGFCGLPWPGRLPGWRRHGRFEAASRRAGKNSLNVLDWSESRAAALPQCGSTWSGNVDGLRALASWVAMRRRPSGRIVAALCSQNQTNSRSSRFFNGLDFLRWLFSGPNRGTPGVIGRGSARQDGRLLRDSSANPNKPKEPSLSIG